MTTVQEALLEYVGKICPIILGAESLEGKKIVPSSDAESASISKFITDTNQDVLTVQLVSSSDGQNFKFGTDVSNTEFPTIGLVKKSHGHLEQKMEKTVKHGKNVSGTAAVAPDSANVLGPCVLGDQKP